MRGRRGNSVDAEVIATACEALAATGLSDGVYIELAHAAITRDALEGVPIAMREAAAEALSRRDGAAWRSLLRDLPEASRALDTIAALAGDADVLIEARTALGERARPALDALVALRDALVAEGYGDRGLVDKLGEHRGGGYYTGTHFQIVCEGAGDAVVSGSRYDELLGKYGAPMPATGCAIDLEALEELLVDRGGAPRDQTPERVLVGGPDDARRPVAARLRAEGRHVGELATERAEEVVRYAGAYGYSRAVICATDGRLCELLPTR